MGSYCVRFLGGRLELAFPGRRIDTPTAPAMVGPLVVLALHPRRPVGLEALKAHLCEYDPSDVTTAQIQTPMSRLRQAGLPIPNRQYMLDVAPADVDVIDFDHRAKSFIERGIQSDRGAGPDVELLIEEGYRLHELWQEDPLVAVGDQVRLYTLFERYRRRNRRFGEVLVRLLIRWGDRDRAQDLLGDLIDRYGTDEIPQDLELTVSRMPRPSDLDVTPAHGVPLLAGPVPEGGALAELWDRVAASAHLDLAQVALGAHNLDRIHSVDHLAVDHESRIRGVAVEAPGGAAANTALALARMGHRVAVAGMVADDRDGALLRQSFAVEDVDIENLLVSPSIEASTGYSMIFSDPHGRWEDFVEPGVNESYAQALNDDKARHARLVDDIRNARLFNLSSFTGDAERRLQEDILRGLPSDTVVAFDPGTFYCRLRLDRLAPFILRCDVLNVYEERLRLLVENSSADPGSANGYSFRATLDALFRWRGLRVGRPLVVVVKRDRQQGPGLGEASAEDYDMITIAVGRRSVEDMVSAARSPRDLVVADITGQGEAIAAGVHLGLLSGAPLVECADLAYVFANEANSEIGARAGLPRRSTIAAAWAKWLPGRALPGWVPHV